MAARHSLNASVSVNFKGDKKLLRAMKSIEKQTTGSSKKFLRRAMREGLRPVLKEAKRRAAAVTSDANETELMRAVSRGLKIRAMKRSRKHFGLRIVTPPRNKLGLPPYSKRGPGRFYAPAHVELGTKRNRARPFLRGALEAKKTRSLRVFRVTLMRLIRGETVKYR